MAVDTEERRYGGDLKRYPLCQMKTHGRGDDIFVVVDHEHHSRFGVLGIGNNARDYRLAKKMALDEESFKSGCPMMIAVEDEESGSPMMLAHELIHNGKKHYLAVLFNASFAFNPEETSDGSFCLRLSSRLDPEGKFSERIRYTPGKNIDWCAEQVKFLTDMLEA